MPHTLRDLASDDETIAALQMIVGYDDLAAEATRVRNRLRGLLTQIHPRWNASWAPAPTTQPCSPCSNASAPRPS